MADYGFKIATFTLASLRSTMQVLPLNYPVIGPEGAYGLFQETIAKAFADGGKTGPRGDYLELVDIRRLQNALVITSKGGGTGEEFDIIRTSTGTQEGVVGEDDALTWTSRIVIIFPQDKYDGMIVSETKGNRHHAPSLINALEAALRTEHEYKLDVTHDVADLVGWKQILKSETLAVPTVEFWYAPGHNDDTEYPEDSDISRIKIEYSIAKGSRLERQVAKLITSEKPDKKQLLKQLVGGRRYTGTDLDGEAATIVSNGRPRKYRVSKRQSWFNYHIESNARLEDREFIYEITPAVIETYSKLSISLSGQWATPVE
ncbi:hypothetical protein JOF48_002765 [Arthrobacter stackebrandtii]|uniref:Uncharacterized protein n=1 Tax=Arthrobacter stackebrandtii TaxID=272161 RepID=A0ABS4YYT4_9MICC|nr:hypothetical protein [Arthrobacter stackebrandtii]MBP2413966.1 hypothetical protein [Arthrobacter stackebrandtii]PYH00524.1 hypothetical protein CVV67_10560 [Arthrobacter stackebrandtii]